MDALNARLINDKALRRAFDYLRPYRGALDAGKPRKISNTLALPGPIIATTANWLYSRK